MQKLENILFVATKTWINSRSNSQHVFATETKLHLYIFYIFLFAEIFFLNEQNYNIAILIVRYVLLIRTRDTKIALHREIAICLICGAFHNS